MPVFLHFWQGTVNYGDYLDMPYVDWQRMRLYMEAHQAEVERQIAGR